MTLTFTVHGESIAVTPSHLVIAGWTGRDRTAVEHHIEELAALGVARPSTLPVFYRAAASRLTQAGLIEVVGGGSSGEVEPVIVATDRGLVLTVGSDHTDRDLEAHSVALSKAIVEKPVGRMAVPFDASADLDSARLEADIADGAEFTPYQRGTLAAIRPLGELLDGARRVLGGLPAGTVVFCGTVPAIGGIRPAGRFRGTLALPGAAPLVVEYTVETLPVVS